MVLSITSLNPTFTTAGLVLVAFEVDWTIRVFVPLFMILSELLLIVKVFLPSIVVLLAPPKVKLLFPFILYSKFPLPIKSFPPAAKCK